MIPTAEGYDFLTWAENEGNFILNSEAQQHFPAVQGMQFESSVHTQSAHEQFFISYYYT